MGSKILTFKIQMPNSMTEIRNLLGRYHVDGRRAVNATQWRGKEPRSCAVTRIRSKPHVTTDTNPVEVEIEVTYRTAEHVSYVGKTRYQGWTAMVLDRGKSGELLDGKGQLLEAGKPPVFLPVEVCPDLEFGDLEFGTLVSEVDLPTIARISHADVFKEIHASGRFDETGSSSFVAARRQRPTKKIILSNATTGDGQGDFNTTVRNISLNTPNFEFVLAEELATLMCEFLDGQVSITSHLVGNKIFVDLSDSLVDCEPNETGNPSEFDVLWANTSGTFMSDLAARLMSQYRITADVVTNDIGSAEGLLIGRED